MGSSPAPARVANIVDRFHETSPQSAARYDEIMAHPSRQLSLVRDPIDVIVRRLSALPPSPRVEALRLKTEEYLREVDGWVVAPPTADKRDRLMKDVLKLHVEVVELERERAGE